MGSKENVLNNASLSKESLDVYNIITGILDAVSLGDEIKCTDCKEYFVVHITTEIYWICRVRFTEEDKSITFPINGYEGEKTISISSIDELTEYANEFISAYNNAVHMYLISTDQ